MILEQQIQQLAERARAASRATAALPGDQRSKILRAMADGIDAGEAAILAANALDVAAGVAAGLTDAFVDRLLLNPERVAAMSEGVRQVAGLPDPLGEVLAEITPPSGIRIRKVRVPLGVIAMIYESRPNVTADAAALCFKAGNAVILRGGSEATRSNRAILDAMRRGAAALPLPEHAIQLVPVTDRAGVRELLRQDRFIDLVIPRGGEGLIRAVAEHSRIPVLKHYQGVCHLYVDASADLEMARAILVNGKCQRPGVCNALESLLVHDSIARDFLPAAGADLAQRGVELRGDPGTCALLTHALPADEDDWSREYLDLIISIRIVPDLDAAIDHINCYGTHHSDVIVTSDTDAAARFTRDVDSATVYVNASSRFTDGFEFGMGAEIGISTDKLHARGPCGVEELTTYKYVIHGSGHVRA